MQGDQPQRGYDLLTHLRRLETRMGRLQKRWETFRADPRPERLEEFRRAFSGTDRALGELAGQLGQPPAGRDHAGGGPGGGAAGSAEAAAIPSAGEVAGRTPTGTANHAGNQAGSQAGAIGPLGADARSVVEAGRTLDNTLAEIQRAWRFLRRDPDPEGLAGLADRLARAEAAASLLGHALPRAEWFDPDAEPSPPPASPMAAGSLDALLARIRDDWQGLRREPAPDRAGMLRSELAEARRLAEALRDQVAVPDRHETFTARYLTGMADSVRFGPYRDAFTGLYNREGFDTLAGAELKRCRRYSRSFGLLVMDVHADDLAVLRGTIATLQSLLRGYDLVSRYADRRITVGLPETDGSETRRIAARLLRALEAEGASPVRRLSYALMPEDAVTLAALIDAAEARLSG